MFGILMSLGIKAASSIGCWYENELSKKQTAHRDRNGNIVSYGSGSATYVNGEKVYTYSQKDKYGHIHILTIGCNSGKVYDDSYDHPEADRGRNPLRWMSAKAKERAIEDGKLAYYDSDDPRFTGSVLREISTGKIITCLFKYKVKGETVERYRKWYLTDKVYKEWGCASAREIEEGDIGIEITREEYWKLGGDSAYPCSHIPDLDIVKKLQDPNYN